MSYSRLKDSFRKLVLDILAEEGPPPAWRLVPARVVSVNGNLVDVIFDDPASLVKFKSKIPLLTGVGETVEISSGSKVLVGWQACDERYPFALYGSWIGDGSLKSWTITASSSVALGAQASDCDAVVTKKDLENLLAAINTAQATPSTAMAVLYTQLTTLFNWPDGVGSGRVKAKR